MIPLFKVYISPAVHKPVSDVLNSGYLTQGPQVEQFEYLLRKWLDVAHVLTLNSATSGLQLASTLAGLGPKTYAISTPNTCSATSTAILSTGANIIWADIDPHTGNITPEAIEYLLKKYQKQYDIKAVMCVDWGGLQCDFDEIFEITSKYGVKIIRDAAHAWGATYHNALVPVNVDYTVYSFQAIKHLSCSDGGVLICQNHHDHALGKKLRWYGIDREAAVGDLRCDADVKIAGWKYHMNDLNATIGIHQMPDTDEIIAIHQRNGKYYNKRFLKSHPKHLNIPARYYNTQIHKSSYWIYTLLVTQPTQFMERLLDEGGIQSSRVHSRNDRYTMLKNAFQGMQLIGVDAFCAKQINIPCGWWVSEKDAEIIADLTVEISETI